MTEHEFRTHVAGLVEQSCGSAAAVARKHKIHPKALTLFLNGARGPSAEVVRAFGYERHYLPVGQADAILALHPPASEPFGYWVEQKGAEPALLRKPAYIPEPSDLRTVTPLFAAPPASDAAKDAEIAALKERVGVLEGAVECALGCWDAAVAEGLPERLSELNDDEGPCSLSGLFARRLNWAEPRLRAALNPEASQ